MRIDPFLFWIFLDVTFACHGTMSRVILHLESWSTGVFCSPFDRDPQVTREKHWKKNVYHDPSRQFLQNHDPFPEYPSLPQFHGLKSGSIGPQDPIVQYRARLLRRDVAVFCGLIYGSQNVRTF